MASTLLPLVTPRLLCASQACATLGVRLVEKAAHWSSHATWQEAFLTSRCAPGPAVPVPYNPYSHSYVPSTTVFASGTKGLVPERVPERVPVLVL